MISKFTRDAIFSALIILLSTHMTVTNEEQWHIEYLNIPKSHRISRGAGVTIAVIDSGVSPDPSLRQALLPGVSFISGDKSPGIDKFGHGTAISGLIAASGESGNQIGVAPESKILPVKVLDESGNGSTDATTKGIRWAVTHGARIINISTTGGPSSDLRSAVNDAISKNVIVIASSGNRPQQTIVGFPAYIDGVVAVGATDEKGSVAAVSVTGDTLSLTAPGVKLLGEFGTNGQSGTGTSGSAAIVSGVAALVWSRYPELSAVEVVHRMTATAVDKGAPGRDPEYGFGIVDPVAALTADVPPLGASAGPVPSSEEGPQAAPTPEADTTGQVAVIVMAGIASLLGVALVIALLIYRRRHRKDGVGESE